MAAHESPRHDQAPTTGSARLNRFGGGSPSAVAVGCGGEEAAILPTGSLAVASNSDGSPLSVIVFDHPADGGEPSHRALTLSPGTHVVVLDDTDRLDARPERRMVQAGRPRSRRLVQLANSETRRRITAKASRMPVGFTRKLTRISWRVSI